MYELIRTYDILDTNSIKFSLTELNIGDYIQVCRDFSYIKTTDMALIVRFIDSKVVQTKVGNNFVNVHQSYIHKVYRIPVIDVTIPTNDFLEL